jgi:ATP-dependent helicase/nuclease subunit A
MDNRTALDPRHSVVVEACAGSGKTWLLVSRIVRLLLDGVKPGEILAITFTRKAAQEMQARLRDWLYELASADDEHAREFLRQRAVPEPDIERLLPHARSLYQQFLLAQPGITISTFHGWFMQILQRAPLNAGMAGGVQLVEQTAELWQEAWQTFLDGLQGQPDGETAQEMQMLFKEFGLSNTQKMMRAFAGKRSEWWAYTAGRRDPLAYALESLRAELDVDMAFDPVSDWGMCGNSEEVYFAFVRQLAGDGTPAQKDKALELERAWTDTVPEKRFGKVLPSLFTLAGEPRSFKPTKKQDAEALLVTRDALFDTLQEVRDTLAGQQAYRMNKAALRCGAALLDTYQTLKQRQQLLDFGDLEWRVRQLLNNSDHAEYLQYKLDSRYRHVLLDEFQDTNPLQWQILQAWFAASAAVQSTPTVFVVGDPKQSIYRFRRADARLFGVVRGVTTKQ